MNEMRFMGHLALSAVAESSLDSRRADGGARRPNDELAHQSEQRARVDHYGTRARQLKLSLGSKATQRTPDSARSFFFLACLRFLISLHCFLTGQTNRQINAARAPR